MGWASGLLLALSGSSLWAQAPVAPVDAGAASPNAVTAPSAAEETSRAYFAITPVSYRGAGARQQTAQPQGRHQ